MYTPTLIAAARPADATPIDWDDAARLFAAERLYMVATTGDDGRPHVRPVLAVWVDGRFYSTTSRDARKGRNLVSRPSGAVSVHAPSMDIVIEGPVAWIDDPGRLDRIGQAYREKYQWPVTVVDGGYEAPYAAPTAGRAPYRLYELTPAVAYAFGTADDLAERSTRFRFDG